MHASMMTLASFALVACHGCATHVALSSPPPGDVREDLVDYCDAMRPHARSTRSGPTIAHARGGRHRFAQYGLELKDGTFVTEPADLIPVVGAESNAGMSAHDAADAQLVVDGANAAALATILTGASLLTLQTMPDETTGLSAALREGLLTTGLVALALTPLPLGALVLASARANDLRTRAFASYETHFDEDRCMGANTRIPPAEATRGAETLESSTVTSSLE